MSIRHFIVGLQLFVVSVLANAQIQHSDSLTLDVFLEDFVSLKPVEEAKVTLFHGKDTTFLGTGQYRYIYIRSRLGLISSRHDCRCFRPALSKWRPRVMRALLRKWIFRKTNINLRPPVTGKPRFVCSRSEKRRWAMWRLRLPKS